jgi:hypoxanthine phosphoribosyltransferase
MDSRALWAKEEILERVSSIVEYFNSTYSPNDQVLFAPVLQGAIPFFSDIIKGVTFDPFVECIGISSYKGEQQKEFNLYRMIDTKYISGKIVWLFDDIADSGNTLNYLTQLLYQRGAQDVKTCVLIKKHHCKYHIDQFGFEMGDGWLWGYGMDSPDGRGRSLNSIYCKL